MPMNYGHHGSARMAELLHPTCGIREAQIRRGITPRDHAKDNRMKLKEMQLKNKQRREAEAAAAAASPKWQSSTKFAAVGSRVAAQMARPASAPRPPTHTPELRNFSCPKPCGPAGRVFTAWAPPPLLNEGGAELPRREKRNPPVPLRQPPPPKPPPVDFVKRNTELSSLTPRKAAAAAASSPGSPPGTGGKSRYHGRLPPYLLDRKLELAKVAEAKADAAKPRECPEGTHVLAEEERQRVLDLVKRGQERMHKELDAMPFVIDTYGLKEKQLQLTRQLAQLDAAEKAFSRTKVIVTDDEQPIASMSSALPPTPPEANEPVEPIEVPAPATEAEEAIALEVS